MAGNSVFRHHQSGVLSVAAIEAPEVITSEWIDDQLADAYDRNGVRPGLLGGVAGIHERRWWGRDVSFADAAEMAGRAAIEKAGIDPADIGVLISTSVCKDHLEPSMACAVHHKLGLGASCVNYDIGNACLGFMNAMQVASTMLDAGTVDYALIVDGEGSRYTQETTLERLRRPESTMADIFAEFASLTLGSGAAAMVLARTDRHPEAHRIVGGFARAATQHHLLCVGSLDRMTTDTGGLLAGGLDLVADAWTDAMHDPEWSQSADWYILHQVSKVHTAMVAQRIGIDLNKVPLTYPRFGNIGPAAVPFTLASVEDRIQPGDRVFCMGVGSGLNMSLLEIIW